MRSQTPCPQRAAKHHPTADYAYAGRPGFPTVQAWLAVNLTQRGPPHTAFLLGQRLPRPPPWMLITRNNALCPQSAEAYLPEPGAGL